MDEVEECRKGGKGALGEVNGDPWQGSDGLISKLLAIQTMQCTRAKAALMYKVAANTLYRTNRRNHHLIS